ncbi:MAG: hypothetical protein IIX16_03175 [Clostridia bacterium]|nr:hypothetical protein [Clostridia bacterium]
MKNTDQLMDELMKAHNISDYLKENSIYMISDELPTYLTNILKKKRLVKSVVIKNSELSEVMGYQIFSGTRKPSRDSLLSICIAMGLDVEETQEILKIAQFASLYPKAKRDCIIINGIATNKSVSQINETLYELNENTINQ